MLQLFGYISGFLAILCYAPYIRDILKRTTQPERASWLIWMVLGLIAFFSQLSEGASDSLWVTGIETFGVSVVFLLALKFGVGGFTRKDIIALVGASIGLLLWYVTSNASTALYIVIAIDAIGVILTVMKAYKDPSSETFSTWVLAGLAGVFASFAVGKFDYVLLAYPFYLFLMNCAVCVAMVAGRAKQSKKALSQLQ